MRLSLTALWVSISLQAISQCSFNICSWNIANFEKFKNPDVIRFIAATVKNYDIVSVVEIVAGKGGPEAVEALKKN